MYHIRTFKVIDVLIQISLSLGFLLYWKISGERADAFFAALFVIGGWQVLSCVVHLLAVDKSARGESRRAYEWALLSSLTIGWALLFFYLFIGPAMAIWYFVTCLVETRRYTSHPKSTYH